MQVGGMNARRCEEKLSRCLSVKRNNLLLILSALAGPLANDATIMGNLQLIPLMIVLNLLMLQILLILGKKLECSN